MSRILIFEEWHHFIPTGKSWAYGLYHLGNDVFHIAPSEINDNTLKDLYDLNLDVIIWFDVNISPQSHAFMKKLKEVTNTKIIVAVGLDYKPQYYDFRDIIDYWVSTTYKHERADYNFRTNGYDLIHIPLAASEILFFNIDNIEKEYDVSFIGQFGITGHGNRNEDKYLFPIIDEPNFKGFYSGFIYNQKGYGTVSYERLNKIYNSTKVNLNFHYDNQKGTTDRIDFNARTFEICLSKQFQLCDHPYIKELIPSMYVETNPKDWKETVYYFLENEDMRNTIATETFNEVIENHLWTHRMQTLLNKITQGVR